jgi:hypothetical protein
VHTPYQMAGWTLSGQSLRDCRPPHGAISAGSALVAAASPAEGARPLGTPGLRSALALLAERLRTALGRPYGAAGEAWMARPLAALLAYCEVRLRTLVQFARLAGLMEAARRPRSLGRTRRGELHHAEGVRHLRGSRCDPCSVSRIRPGVLLAAKVAHLREHDIGGNQSSPPRRAHSRSIATSARPGSKASRRRRS